MDTLHDRLAELADDAPTGGAPAAELWARGKRTHRLRVAALAASVIVCAIGAGLGVRIADRHGTGADLAPAGTDGITLPIKYPVGEALPDLGDTPGPLAAIWLAARASGGAPEAVGLVAGTGKFGTLPIELSSDYQAPDSYLALSPDGRRIAYAPSTGGLVVRDLVGGDVSTPKFRFDIRAGYTWVDATHLFGHVAGGTDVDGWVWTPGTRPTRIDLRTYPGSPYLGPYAGQDPWFLTAPQDGDPRSCSSLKDMGGVRKPVLCDVVGVIGAKIVLTHDGSGAVVATDVQGVANPALRHVVATAGAPQLVTFATALIAEALDAAGGAS
jgi:hypothetical protein